MLVTIILTSVFYVWLFGVLLLLWSIWQKATRHIHNMEQQLFSNAAKSADAAKAAAEAAKQVAELVEKKP